MEAPHFTATTPVEHLELFVDAMIHQAVQDAKEDISWDPQVLKGDLSIQVPELGMWSKSIRGSSVRSVKVSGILRASPKVYCSYCFKLQIKLNIQKFTRFNY